MHEKLINAQYLDNCRTGILTQVTLGSPKFLDCRNFGVCRMRVISEVTHDGCSNCLTGYLRVDIPTGRLLLHFPISLIKGNLQQRFFNNQLFRMDDDFVIPKSIAKGLGFTRETVKIECGTYPILNDEQFLTLSLRVCVVATKVADLPLVA
jgi:hypothetical protein